MNTQCLLGPSSQTRFRLSFVVNFYVDVSCQSFNASADQPIHTRRTHTQADATFCQVFEKFFCNLNFFWRVLVGEYRRRREGETCEWCYGEWWVDVVGKSQHMSKLKIIYGEGRNARAAVQLLQKRRWRGSREVTRETATQKEQLLLLLLCLANLKLLLKR